MLVLLKSISIYFTISTFVLCVRCQENDVFFLDTENLLDIENYQMEIPPEEDYDEAYNQSVPLTNQVYGEFDELSGNYAPAPKSTNNFNVGEWIKGRSFGHHSLVLPQSVLDVVSDDEEDPPNESDLDLAGRSFAQAVNGNGVGIWEEFTDIEEFEGNTDQTTTHDDNTEIDVVTTVAYDQISDSTLQQAETDSGQLSNDTADESEGASKRSSHGTGRNFNRCSVNPYPCKPNERCNWQNRRVLCVPIQVPKLFCSSNPCINGGTCFENNNGYRCVCPQGYSGLRCQISGACSPNPCQGNCKCVESCKHEFGYYCQSDGTRIGKNCSIPIPRVSCESRSIRVDLFSYFLRQYDHGHGSSIIYASPHPWTSHQKSHMTQCQAHAIGKSYKLEIELPFDQCGMTRIGKSNQQVYRNRIWMDRRGRNFDVPVPLVDFECTYTREYSVVASIKPFFTSPTMIRNNGKYSASLELCKVSSCPEKCPSVYTVSTGATYTTGEMIYLRITGDEMNNNAGVVASIEKLVMSCSATHETSPVYLIQNGCQTVSGLYVTARAGKSVCVTIQTPRSLSCSIIYLHVHMRLCNVNQLQTCGAGSGLHKCASAIGKRRRSAGIVQDKSDESIFSVIGPMLILNGSKGKEDVRLPNADFDTVVANAQIEDEPPLEQPPTPAKVLDSQESGLRLNYLVAFGSLLAGLCLILLLTMIYSFWSPRRRLHQLDSAT